MKHKFINKKAGAEARVIAMYLDSDGVMQVDGYDTVEDLMDDYAAYEEYNPPKEPLIEDEKVRKAVRAWADANGIHNPKFTHEDMDIVFDTEEHRLTWIDTSIEFDMITGLENLKDGRCYTIAELCGEEEE